MTIYSEDELWFPSNPIYTGLQKDKNYPLKTQLWMASIKEQVIDVNRNLPFEPLSPVPYRIFNIWKPEIKIHLSIVINWIFFNNLL